MIEVSWNDESSKIPTSILSNGTSLRHLSQNAATQIQSEDLDELALKL